jgi:CubicO group peptidase (beta-lactamase class C family)
MQLGEEYYLQAVAEFTPHGRSSGGQARQAVAGADHLTGGALARCLIAAPALLAALVAVGCDSSDSPTGPEAATLTEAIGELAEEYVGVGAMVGVVRPGETLVLSYGTKRFGANDPPDRHSVFEIGSITKTFTTTLLAQRVLNGTLDPNELVQAYLPADRVTLPTRDGVEISFIQLATHRSGLPKQIQDSDYPKPPGYDDLNFYAAYTTDHVYDYLTDYCSLEFTPGSDWLYSNTGVGLLGHIIGLIDGTSYETVVTREIFDVLGMESSSLFFTEAQEANLALGHSSSRTVTPNYTAQDIYQGAGFIKSSLDDMLVYLNANMGSTVTPLSNAMEYAQDPRFLVDYWGESGLDWYTKQLDDGQVVTYKGGRTSGYGAYIGFNKSASTGTVVLMNHSVSGRAMLLGESVQKAIALY